MRNETGSISLGAILVGAALCLVAGLVATLALQAPIGGMGPSIKSPSADSTTVPIETRFAIGPLAVGPSRPRTDLSVIVVSAYSSAPDRATVWGSGEFWLADDKANRLESMIVRGRIVPGVMGSALLSLQKLAISNPSHLPVGDDMEDLARLATTEREPIYVAASGETGPGGRGVSWLYLFEQRDARLTLRWSGQGSPPGETVGNNGFEGVVLIRLGADTLALLGFKERPDPTYVRSFLFREIPGVHGPLVFAAAAGTDSVTLEPIEPAGMDWIDGIKTQAGACIGPDGDLYVVDRFRRRIAIVDRRQLDAAIRDTAENRIPVKEWLDFAALEATLENKTDPGAPLSLFGAVEGIAFDPEGRLYLLADNNESGPPTLLTLVRKGAGAGR